MPAPLSFTLTWRPQRWGSGPVNRWYVYGPPPVDACGGVWRERGLWRAEVWPHRRKVLGAYYVRRDKAMAHVERWLRAHPGVVAAAFDPRGIKGRIEGRANHLLMEFVRTHPPDSPPLLGQALHKGRQSLAPRK